MTTDLDRLRAERARIDARIRSEQARARAVAEREAREAARVAALREYLAEPRTLTAFALHAGVTRRHAMRVLVALGAVSYIDPEAVPRGSRTRMLWRLSPPVTTGPGASPDAGPGMGGGYGSREETP